VPAAKEPGISGRTRSGALYVESSALLRILLEGDRSLSEAVAGYSRLFTSALTLVEVPRALSRAVREGRLDATEHGRVHRRFAGFAAATIVAEFTKAVRERAALDFPVEPVRSLDAIHLATLVVWKDTLGPLVVASCDDRVVRNALALGFSVIPGSASSTRS
jgi:predicted nucleic acid-binding protein